MVVLVHRDKQEMFLFFNAVFSVPDKNPAVLLAVFSASLCLTIEANPSPLFVAKPRW